jgi:hypothetical protein
MEPSNRLKVRIYGVITILYIVKSDIFGKYVPKRIRELISMYHNEILIACYSIFVYYYLNASH